MEFDTNVAEWLQNVIKNTQALTDAKYQSEVGEFKAACEQWIENGVRNRDAGLAVEPFTKVAPAQKIWGAVNGQLTYFEQTDPSLVAPVLPAKVPGQPAIAFSTSAGQTQDMLAAILQLLVQIKSQTDKIK